MQLSYNIICPVTMGELMLAIDFNLIYKYIVKIVKRNISLVYC